MESNRRLEMIRKQAHSDGQSRLQAKAAAMLPENPIRSCTVSKGIWYDAGKQRYRASIGRSYRSKWFLTQDGAESHRRDKLHSIEIEKIKQQIAVLTTELKDLEEKRCETGK